MQPANHTAWLEQLESAQWQQRLRYQSDGGQQQSSGSGSDATREQTAARAPAASARTDAPADMRHQAAAVTRPAGERGTHATVNTAMVRTADMRQAVSPRPASPQLPTALGDEPTRDGATQARRLSAMQWQARNAHVMLGTDGLQVWLRDANYREGDGQKLLRALRGLFARLGLRLAQFTLNGSQVSEPDHFD